MTNALGNGGRDATRASPRPAADHRGGRHHLASLTICAAAALALAGFATAVRAQETAAPPPSTQASGPTAIPSSPDILAGMPDSLLGASALRIPDSPLLTYFPRNLGRDPMIGIMAGPTTTPSTPEMERTTARTAFHETGLREIIREGSFATPKWPNALTFFGEYRTGMGFKQVWSVDTGTERINLIATYFKAKDSARVQAEVAEKIFGGATVTAAKPAE